MAWLSVISYQLSVISYFVKYLSFFEIAGG